MSVSRRPAARIAPQSAAHSEPHPLDVQSFRSLSGYARKHDRHDDAPLALAGEQRFDGQVSSDGASVTHLHRVEALIAALPSRVLDVTPADLLAVAAAHAEINAEHDAAMTVVERSQVVIAAAPDHEPIADLVDSDELTAALETLADCAAATRALLAWSRRSGTARLMRATARRRGARL